MIAGFVVLKKGILYSLATSRSASFAPDKIVFSKKASFTSLPNSCSCLHYN